MLMPFDTDNSVLRRLARLPLRSLAFLKYPLTVQNHTYTYVSLDTLSRSLNELEIYRSPRTDTPFLAVQKLGIRETALRTFVADATTAFPNVSHLVLRQPDMNFARGVAFNKERLEDARTHNKTQWESPQYRDAWPSVSAIWAADPSFLYQLGFARRVASVSLRMGSLVSEEYIKPVLADTSPSSLELRVDMGSFGYAETNWGRVLEGSESIRSLTLLLYPSYSLGDDNRRVGSMLKRLSAILPTLPSLTHFLIRFAPKPYEPGSELYMSWDCPPWPSQTQIDVAYDAIQNHLRILAARSTSLRWIGYEACGWGIKSWDISRSADNGSRGGSDSLAGGDDSAARQHTSTGVEIAEMGESESVAVVKSEGMNVFKDVRPILLLVF
ncbi:hypothetical protein GSI_10165 [Ganoderma sinense ZZ0214-1]|uniref:Uncharacterized protein n=1 Tax=Ganoderma sinense ZZ0214-1 TaxID=1077348 RepID=A0A2G8RZT2_9APHY|nr:hypothetical protein GSI_10165 [Ganoderma sinense ZZ0214-1]